MSHSEQFRERVTLLEADVQQRHDAGRYYGVRRRSATRVCGIPWYDIALGADAERGEMRGHARGILAVGDVATGVFAFGGIARGVFAVGGLALGAVSVGGCSVGILAAIGGCAVGALVFGGLAVGLVAIGGGAVGYYAFGGDAFGEHVVDAAQRDPKALHFFRQVIPGFDDLPRAGGR